MQGFIKKHTSVRSEYKDEDGCQVIAYKQVPRGVVSVAKDEWKDFEYLCKILKPVVGDRVYQVNDTTVARDLFLSGVMGPEIPGRDGKRWRQMKIGQLFTKTKQNEETGEMEEISWFKLFQVPNKAEKTSQGDENGSGDDSKQKEAQDTVENL